MSFTSVSLPEPSPEGWIPLDGCPNCGNEVFVGHGSFGATYAYCQVCDWQDTLVEGDPERLSETERDYIDEGARESMAMDAADWWGEDLYSPRGNYR